MFWVYVLYGAEYDKIYIGYTSDLEGRLASHNHGMNRGWTGNYQLWEVAYSEQHESKKEAMKRERQLNSARGK